MLRQPHPCEKGCYVVLRRADNVLALELHLGAELRCYVGAPALGGCLRAAVAQRGGLRSPGCWIAAGRPQLLQQAQPRERPGGLRLRGIWAQVRA